MRFCRATHRLPEGKRSCDDAMQPSIKCYCHCLAGFFTPPAIEVNDAIRSPHLAAGTSDAWNLWRNEHLSFLCGKLLPYSHFLRIFQDISNALEPYTYGIILFDELSNKTYLFHTKYKFLEYSTCGIFLVSHFCEGSTDYL